MTDMLCSKCEKHYIGKGWFCWSGNKRSVPHCNNGNPDKNRILYRLKEQKKSSTMDNRIYTSEMIDNLVEEMVGEQMKPYTAYLICNIEEYGKLISYCINHDITVWRTYWDEREKGDRCYVIDFGNGRCFYSSRKYWENNGFEIVIPQFVCDKYGNYKIVIDETKAGDSDE